MKNSAPLFALALAAALCGPAIAAKYDKQGKICCLTKGETYSASITGTVCKDCIKAVTDALLRIKGVEAASASWPNPYQKGILTVRMKDTVEIKAIQAALRAASAKVGMGAYEAGEFHIVSGAATGAASPHAVVPSGERLVKLNVMGMDCPICVFGIENALKKVPGVQTASVDYGRREAAIYLYAKAATQPEELIKAVASAGYKAEVVR